MLTAAQRDALATVGHARLPAVVDRAVAATMADEVWEHLGHDGIDRHDPSTWPTGFHGKFQRLRKARVFDPFGTAHLATAVDEVLGEGRRGADPDAWGPALVTFPEPGPWRLPHGMWHLDIPGRGDPDQTDQARMFGYLTDLAPRGGATLVVDGSHELVRRMVASSREHDIGSSATVKQALRRQHPWFAALFEGTHPDTPAARIHQFMADGTVIDGVRLRVTELTAEAGDVVVMLPWTLHCLSPNTAARPRMMVTHTIHRSAGGAVTDDRPRPTAQGGRGRAAARRSARA